jgi:hypothetical protein
VEESANSDPPTLLLTVERGQNRPPLIDEIMDLGLLKEEEAGRPPP